MPFCASCGSPVEGRFCPKCGAAIGVAGSPGATATPAAPTAGAPVAPAAAGLAENVACALCYSLGLITGILFLVLAPYNQNKNIRFHAFQCIFYCIAAIALWFVFHFIAIITGGWALILLPVFWLIDLGLFVVWLVLIIKAYQNQKFVLPIIGPLAEQQA
jgi:uncharacterized membrane protein